VAQAAEAGEHEDLRALAARGAVTPAQQGRPREQAAPQQRPGLRATRDLERAAQSGAEPGVSPAQEDAAQEVAAEVDAAPGDLPAGAGQQAGLGVVEAEGELAGQVPLALLAGAGRIGRVVRAEPVQVGAQAGVQAEVAEVPGLQEGAVHAGCGVEVQHLREEGQPGGIGDQRGEGRRGRDNRQRQQDRSRVTSSQPGVRSVARFHLSPPARFTPGSEAPYTRPRPPRPGPPRRGLASSRFPRRCKRHAAAAFPADSRPGQEPARSPPGARQEALDGQSRRERARSRCGSTAVREILQSVGRQRRREG